MMRYTIRVFPVWDAHGTKRFRSTVNYGGRPVYVAPADFPISSQAFTHAKRKRSELKAAAG